MQGEPDYNENTYRGVRGWEGWDEQKIIWEDEGLKITPEKL